jgi:hypothetical protein
MSSVPTLLGCYALDEVHARGRTILFATDPLGGFTTTCGMRKVAKPPTADTVAESAECGMEHTAISYSRAAMAAACSSPAVPDAICPATPSRNALQIPH